MIKILTEIAEELQKSLIEEFVKQGHSLNGKFESQLMFKVTSSVITQFMPAHGKYLNQGVNYNKIPFSLSGNGGTSAYITGLINYAKRRMHAGEKESKRIAFAIAYTQKYKKEGMPTFGSYQYSKNGKRTGFVNDTLKNNEQRIKDLFIKRNREVIIKNINKEIKNSWV